MNHDETFDEFESQLAAGGGAGAPGELRDLVLRDVERELRAGCWDRRMVRAAFVLLVAGVGLNTVLVFMDSPNQGARRPGSMTTARSRDAIVETAIVVSESTNAETGRRFAQQWAAYSGRELTAQEIEALDSLFAKDRG